MLPFYFRGRRQIVATAVQLPAFGVPFRVPFGAPSLCPLVLQYKAYKKTVEEADEGGDTVLWKDFAALLRNIHAEDLHIKAVR